MILASEEEDSIKKQKKTREDVMADNPVASCWVYQLCKYTLISVKNKMAEG